MKTISLFLLIIFTLSACDKKSEWQSICLGKIEQKQLTEKKLKVTQISCSDSYEDKFCTLNMGYLDDNKSTLTTIDCYSKKYNDEQITCFDVSIENPIIDNKDTTILKCKNTDPDTECQAIIPKSLTLGDIENNYEIEFRCKSKTLFKMGSNKLHNWSSGPSNR